MLICPGGGYHNLAWDLEGEDVAAWLNSIGVTGIVLKYRCPRRPGDVKGEPPAGPLKDAQRALSLVRSRAQEWGIDPKKIGMIGFSAGGHLVGSTATNFEKRTYDAIDDIDKVSCRPDFGIMAYSGYFKVKDELSPTVKTPAGAPPLFFRSRHRRHGERRGTQRRVLPRSSVRSSTPRCTSTPPAATASAKQDGPTANWPKECTDWLRQKAF